MCRAHGAVMVEHYCREPLDGFRQTGICLALGGEFLAKIGLLLA